MLINAVSPRTALHPLPSRYYKSEIFQRAQANRGVTDSQYQYNTLSHVEDENRELSTAHTPLLLITGKLPLIVFLLKVGSGISSRHYKIPNIIIYCYHTSQKLPIVHTYDA